MNKAFVILIFMLAGLCSATSASATEFDQTVQADNQPNQSANQAIDTQQKQQTEAQPTQAIDNQANPPAEESQTRSVEFASKLGSGWNLGNSFDSYDLDYDRGEETWDNPPVTRELLQAIKAQGFTSIRLPLTVHYRSDDQGLIQADYLARYQEVVDWALAEDFYVIINLHHDSIEWLNAWDGQVQSQEFQRFSALWAQLTEQFKDYDSDRLLFEAINEPRFDQLDDAQQQVALSNLNRVFHQVVRGSGNENQDRLLLMTTLLGGTDQAKLDALYQEISQFNDPNIMATVHYYGEWAFSNNVGYPLFDEALPQADNPQALGQSQRQASEAFIWRLKETFVHRGIGVVIGEYGLLGYDRSLAVNSLGESYKFIEHLNQLTRYQAISLFLWDNGQHFDRVKQEWASEEFGDIVVQSMFTNSAYGRLFNTSYVRGADADLFIPLVYNGAYFARMFYNGKVLEEGRDYEVNQDGVYLPAGFAGEGGTLTMRFHQGATWNQHVHLVGDMSLSAIELLPGEPLAIPVEFAGHDIKRISLRSQNQLVPLTYLEDFQPEQTAGQLVFSESFVEQLDNGRHQLVIETFAGEKLSYRLIVNSRGLQGIPR